MCRRGVRRGEEYTSWGGGVGRKEEGEERTEEREG